MKIGPYEIHSLETGRFALDGGAMFGVVPKTVWNKKNPADELNRIEMALRILLLKSHDKIILIDTGIGHKFGPKHHDMYAIDFESSNLKKSLKQHDLSPDDVTDVILTHLHFDHAGGATEVQNDKIIPTFKNASYYVQQKNWDWANHPTEKDRASYLKENFIPLMQAEQLTLIDGHTEIFPGISTWLSDGHTIGQQLIRVHDQGDTLIYCADIVPTSSHIGLPYIMGYDLQPLVTLEEKRRLLDQASNENWTIVFEHDPFMPACKVQQGERGVEFKSIVTFD